MKVDPIKPAPTGTPGGGSGGSGSKKDTVPSCREGSDCTKPLVRRAIETQN